MAIFLYPLTHRKFSNCYPFWAWWFPSNPWPWITLYTGRQNIKKDDFEDYDWSSPISITKKKYHKKAWAKWIGFQKQKEEEKAWTHPTKSKNVQRKGKKKMARKNPTTKEWVKEKWRKWHQKGILPMTRNDSWFDHP